jgi:uncharacterized protein YndB with AHSA1/START domain
MRPVSAKVTIDAPRERVYDLLTDLSLRPAFTDHFFGDYRLQRVDPVGPGAAARFRMLGSGAWLDTTIGDDSERPHLVRERGQTGPSNRVPTNTVWELAEAPDRSGSEVTVTFWTEPQNMFDKAREALGGTGLLKRGWKRALARLRDLAETGAKPSRVQVAGMDRLPAFNR